MQRCTPLAETVIKSVGESGATPPLRGVAPSPGPEVEEEKMSKTKKVGTEKRRLNSRAKGAAAEREFAALLRINGYVEARRGQQRSGVDCADVIDGPPHVHFEIKRVERLALRAAVAQAERDAPPGAVPVVATRWNGGEWLAIVPAAWLLRLLRAPERPSDVSPGPTEGSAPASDPRPLWPWLD